MKKTFQLFRQGLFLALALGAANVAMAQSEHRVDQDHLSRYWILLNTHVQMDAPNSGLNLNAPSCAAVTYTIGSDGVPMNVQVVKVSPKSDLGPMAKSAVVNFRYGPSLTNHIGEPVSTYYIVPFNAPDDKAQQQKIMDACRLPGFSQ
ncbi:energy transducer TonB [Rhodanobacter sp. L36]|uniref:energy transducer TonB n=1 Tax=Rhodanobacter sp. L36 TaxID=1747221 RepID=UPI00131C1076|nr:energy transducer TonB [Rhodanobacter sp. L36]